MPNKFFPKVSIVIPVYNGSNFLSQAIDSALEQTYENIEIIVVNDGSKDGGKTAKIAKSYGKKIRYFSKRNGGVSTALNYGIGKMSGQYFSWLSHDDLYKKEKIERQVREIVKYKEPVVLFTGYEMINEFGGELGKVYISKSEDQDLPFSLFYGCPMHGCSLLIPKKIFDTCGLFDPKRRTTQDYDLWFRILARFRFIRIDSLLIKSRIHAGQGTLSMTGLHLRESEELYVEHLKRLSTTINTQEKFFCIADGLLPKFCFRASLLAIKYARKSTNKVVLSKRIKYYFIYYYRLGINFFTIKAVLMKRKLIQR